MFDIDAVGAKLKAAGVKGKCPACGNEERVPGDAPVLLQKGAQGGALQLGEGLETVAIVCTGCGFVQLHALSVLE